MKPEPFTSTPPKAIDPSRLLQRRKKPAATPPPIAAPTGGASVPASLPKK